jgi:hypothetical protein
VSWLTHVWSQETFACTVHDPLQQSWHSVVQSVDPGCSWQLSVHWASQLAEQFSEQSLPLQPATHPAWQSLVHWSLHVNVAGLVVHSVSHVFWQSFVQVVVAVSVHFVEQVVV